MNYSYLKPLFRCKYPANLNRQACLHLVFIKGGVNVGEGDLLIDIYRGV